MLIGPRPRPGAGDSPAMSQQLGTTHISLDVGSSDFIMIDKTKTDDSSDKDIDIGKKVDKILHKLNSISSWILWKFGDEESFPTDLKILLQLESSFPFPQQSNSSSTTTTNHSVKVETELDEGNLNQGQASTGGEYSEAGEDAEKDPFDSEFPILPGAKMDIEFEVHDNIEDIKIEPQADSDTDCCVIGTFTSCDSQKSNNSSSFGFKHAASPASINFNFLKTPILEEEALAQEQSKTPLETPRSNPTATTTKALRSFELEISKYSNCKRKKFINNKKNPMMNIEGSTANQSIQSPLPEDISNSNKIIKKELCSSSPYPLEAKTIPKTSEPELVPVRIPIPINKKQPRLSRAKRRLQKQRWGLGDSVPCLNCKQIHKQLKSSAGAYLKCEICEQGFCLAVDYRDHMKTVHYGAVRTGKRLTCPLPNCDRSYLNRDTLNQHLELAHSGHIYFCPFSNCSYSTGHIGNVSRHNQTVHQNQDPPDPLA